MYKFVSFKSKNGFGHYYTCYSKNGFGIPVQTNRLLPDFYLNEVKLDYFYTNITQKVNMSEELFQYTYVKISFQQKLTIIH